MKKLPKCFLKQRVSQFLNDEGEKEKLLRMEEELHKRVIGQEEAVDAGCKRDSS